MKRTVSLLLAALLLLSACVALAEPRIASEHFSEELLIDEAGIPEAGMTYRMYTEDYIMFVYELSCELGEGEEPTAEEVVEMLYSNCRDWETVPSEPLDSYPTERVHCMCGSNEDTSVIDALIVRTDTHTLAMVIHTPADAYAGDMESYGVGDAARIVEDLFSSATIVDQ